MKKFLFLCISLGLWSGQVYSLTDNADSLKTALAKVSQRAEAAPLKDWLTTQQDIQITYQKVVASDKFQSCHPVVRFLAALTAITTKESIQLYGLIVDDYSSKGGLLQECFGYIWGDQTGNETEQAVYSLGNRMAASMNIIANLNLPNTDPLVWDHLWYHWQTNQRENSLWQKLVMGLASEAIQPAPLNKKYEELPVMVEKKRNKTQTSSGSSFSSSQSTLAPSGITKRLAFLAHEMAAHSVMCAQTGDGTIYAWRSADNWHFIVADTAKLLDQAAQSLGQLMTIPSTEQLLSRLGISEFTPITSYEVTPGATIAS